MLTPLHVTLNGNLLSALAYMPSYAPKLGVELKKIYGIDVVQMDKERQWLPGMWDKLWIPAQDQEPRDRNYKFVIETTNLAASASGHIIFEHSYLRVYRSDAELTSGPGMVE